ncbi:hypothetical protein [Paraliomyxa miuraensis]|uniref:hypothetical protein n=1 Tax=Paraliomyxa miuraensis TaxID=376150 RepID=UPI00225A6564|nr:hypothetical protein [Paraliomyxa miuraensis]MCX4241415.1 hypothetical protein [Paraliomyxa miuraensis]
MRSPTCIALASSLALACTLPGCQRAPKPEPVGATAAPEQPPVQRVERVDASRFEGRWEGTVGGMRVRSPTDQTSLEPGDEVSLCSFGIGCRVPYAPSELGPDGGTIEGKPGMCVLALLTEDGQEYALLFAEPPDATITVTSDELVIELRGVEDDTGRAVALRFSGRPAARSL